MALDSYVNLKASVRNWSHRNDMPDSLIDDFIDLAETAMWQLLEIRDMSVRATASTNATRFLALPANFIKMRRLSILSGNDVIDVKYATPESMIVTATSGRPRFFTVTTQLEFDRIPDAVYITEMTYFNELTPLSDANTTNAVLNRFPQVYLFGALHYLFSFGNFDSEAQMYLVKFSEAIKLANKQDRKGRYGPAMAGRREGLTP